MWENAYYGDYDNSDTDETKIRRHIPVPCRTCEAVLRKLTVTLYYCATCHQGFCNEHGNFAGPGRGRCIHCGPHPAASS